MIKMFFLLNCFCFCDKYVIVMFFLFVKKKKKCGKRFILLLKNKEYFKYNRIYLEGFKLIDINFIFLYFISICICMYMKFV